VFVVQQLGMIEIRTVDLCRGTIGDRPDVGGERFRIVLLDTLIALPKSISDNASQSLSGGLREPVGFRSFTLRLISIYLSAPSVYLLLI
jgi:hypothetical protein